MNGIKQIRRADANDLEGLLILFNAYRHFYARNDFEQARRFLADRLNKKDSVIFVAKIDDTLAGFTQLYPTFSSISAKSAWILNDLYVAEQARKYGIATLLIEQALQFCRSTDAAWVSLQTTRDNFTAQSLYKRLGFELDENYCTFSYSL